jgi:hypothetical protein
MKKAILFLGLGLLAGYSLAQNPEKNIKFAERMNLVEKNSVKVTLNGKIVFSYTVPTGKKTTGIVLVNGIEK